MKNQLLTIAVILCSWNLLFSSGPVQNLTPLNSPIIEGEQVYFLSTASYPGSGECNATLVHDFGPNATFNNMPFMIFLNGSIPFNMVVGPVVFDMPGMVNATQLFVNSTCGEPDDNPFVLPLDILPDTPIPTLSQWGLIVVGFFLMIFGVVTLKKKEKVVTT